MTERDYYEALGVDRNASNADVKKAYRRLAMRYHPDRNPDQVEEAANRFKEVKRAYEVLSNADKRSAYDQFSHAGVDAAGESGRPRRGRQAAVPAMGGAFWICLAVLAILWGLVVGLVALGNAFGVEALVGLGINVLVLPAFGFSIVFFGFVIGVALGFDFGDDFGDDFVDKKVARWICLAVGLAAFWFFLLA